MRRVVDDQYSEAILDRRASDHFPGVPALPPGIHRLRVKGGLCQPMLAGLTGA